MAIYILFDHYAGYCRLEPVPSGLTQKQLDELKEQLKQLSRSYRAVKLVRDVTEHLVAGPMFNRGHRRGDGTEELEDGYAGGNRSRRFI